MPFIKRNENNEIVSVFATPQFEGDIYHEDNDQEILDFYNKLQNKGN